MSATLRVDLLDALTVKELDIASRMLGEDIVGAITTGTAGRWKGLALLAYMTSKRQGDPACKLADFLDLPADELVARLADLAGAGTVLHELEEAEAELERLERLAGADPEVALAAAEAQSVDEGPKRSVSGPESNGRAAAEPGGAEENPTKRPRASSSRGPGARPRARSRT